MSTTAHEATGAPDAPGRSPVLDVRGLAVTFATDAGDVRAVKRADFSVAPGEVVAVVGESGSGKTVMAKTVLGLLPDTADATGAVVISGQDVLSVPADELRRIRGREAAMIFQEPSTALNPVYTVGWQIAEGLRAHGGVSRKEAKRRAIEALRTVGIVDAVHCGVLPC